MHAGDLDECRELVAGVPGSAVYVYPGGAHLFAEPASGQYDPQATGPLLARSLASLSALVPQQVANRWRGWPAGRSRRSRHMTAIRSPRSAQADSKSRRRYSISMTASP